MRKKAATYLLEFSIFLLGIYVIVQGGTRIIEEWKMDVNEKLTEMAQDTFLPGISYVMKDKEEDGSNWLENQVRRLFPITDYISEKGEEELLVEDVLTYELLLQEQAKDEERMSEDLEEIEAGVTAQVDAAITSATDLSMDKLQDFSYLLSKFYTVDSTTTIGADQLNAEEFMAKDMHISTTAEGPKVLIFHTHSQESFADSIPGDASTSIVGIGAYLAEQLNAKGIETMHHAGVYDLIDGELDRSRAYELSENGVKEILNQYPSIEVVIDLHRDGVREDLHLVTEVDGKQTARIMFFNGLSRTKTNGDIAYLYNPYIQDNLAFSFQMQLASETMYPGLARKIYLKGYRYSLHMMPKSLLVEAGAQTNTVAEMKNAMDLLANILEEVLVQ